MFIYLIYASLASLAYQGYNAMEMDPPKNGAHGNYVPIESERPSK